MWVAYGPKGRVREGHLERIWSEVPASAAFGNGGCILIQPVTALVSCESIACFARMGYCGRLVGGIP